MKYFKKIYICGILLCLNITFGFAENEAPEPEEKSIFPALIGGIFTNTVFNVTARIFGADFAKTGIDSIYTNLTSRWEWDNDTFLFNHPGHPYQGGLYHAAARSNGFNFYESIPFDFIGSLTWELFGENKLPSINDLIVTTFGGAAFGEMLYLLYLEVPSPWAGVFVSPMAALNNAVFRKTPMRTNNLYHLSVMTYGGWIRTIKEDRQYIRDMDNRSDLTYIFTPNVGATVIYGNPFNQNSKKPYSHFEILMQFGISFYPLWLDWTLLTDGYLLSWNPVHTEKDVLSTGLTFHYDFIAGNNTNFASNALNWSLKWKRYFTDTRLELRSHVGWMILGSSEYYPFTERIGNFLEVGESENNYGTGTNFKLFFPYIIKNMAILT